LSCATAERYLDKRPCQAADQLLGKRKLRELPISSSMYST
jgi:hypothetical protein